MYPFLKFIACFFISLAIVVALAAVDAHIGRAETTPAEKGEQLSRMSYITEIQLKDGTRCVTFGGPGHGFGGISCDWKH